MCRRQDLNLHALSGHQPLKLARLPIPPLRQILYMALAPARRPLQDPQSAVLTVPPNGQAHSTRSILYSIWQEKSNCVGDFCSPIGIFGLHFCLTECFTFHKIDLLKDANDFETLCRQKIDKEQYTWLAYVVSRVTRRRQSLKRQPLMRSER